MSELPITALRDFFAAHALASISRLMSLDPVAAAKIAYQIADAMVKQRSS